MASFYSRNGGFGSNPFTKLRSRHTPHPKILPEAKTEEATPTAAQVAERLCGQAGVAVRFFRPRADVVPYREGKSRCGRKKTIPTECHACPNWKRAYFGVPSAALHALVGDGIRGKRRDIQYLKCQACKTGFTSRLNTPLYRLKTDPERVTLVLLFLAEGGDISVLVRCTRHAEQTVTRWLERTGTAGDYTTASFAS